MAGWLTDRTPILVLMFQIMAWGDFTEPPSAPRALTAGRVPQTVWSIPPSTGRSPETASFQLWDPRLLRHPRTAWLRYG
ncbi:hypothetical protein KUCAC02_017153 [Chaenocephalus aceratus]|uniref:Uncharacterized protein n=1 Tax=Chaenocephalus aceratus TaxID=36190 RepID=A0ACB9W149_CHAAC|nr:hypothetical protein KUCAC02_017153 [Chaenocephalus aceratus]